MYIDQDQGRAAAAKKIRKAHRAPQEGFLSGLVKAQQSEQSSGVDPNKHLSAASLFNIAYEHKRRMRKSAAPSVDRQRILKAIARKNLGMQWNGIPKNVDLIKMQHERPQPFDWDMLTKASFGKLALPAQSSNGMNDNTRSNDGATLAHDAVDDEGNGVRTRATIVGNQSVTAASQNSNLSAALDAIKKDQQRKPRNAMAWM